MPALDGLVSTAQQKIDKGISYVIIGVVLIAGFLLLSSLFRFLFGKKAQIGKAITSGMEILCLYAIYIVIYAFQLHWNVFVNPLPFMTLNENTLFIFTFVDANFTVICSEVLRLLILAFLINLMNSIIPEGKKLLSWLLLRSGTVVLAVFVNQAADYALNLWLPTGFGVFAPFILVGVLLLLILLGSLKLLVGIALSTANPIVGALYTFFFSNFIGRALARAILTTGLLTALVYLMDSLGLATIAITTPVLMAAIPVAMVLILLWYVVDRAV